MARKPLSAEQQEDARRLRDLWAVKKDQLGLTQTTVAETCGWTQGAFSQFLLGRVPLSADAAGKLARVLKVAPQEIMPSIVEDAGALLGLSPAAVVLAQQIERLSPANRTRVEEFVRSLSEVKVHIITEEREPVRVAARIHAPKSTDDEA